MLSYLLHGINQRLIELLFVQVECRQNLPQKLWAAVKKDEKIVSNLTIRKKKNKTKIFISSNE